MCTPQCNVIKGYHIAYSLLNVLICPIAIAYSMGQIIKSVCVCQCVSVCEHSRVAFLDRFSPELP